MCGYEVRIEKVHVVQLGTLPRDVAQRVSDSREGLDPPVESQGPIGSMNVSDPGYQSGLPYRGPVDSSGPESAGAATDDAVLAALGWLARHQNQDGSWSVDRFDRHCSGVRCGGVGGARCDDCVTALAVLAFLGSDDDLLFRGVLEDAADPDRPIDLDRVVSRAQSWISARRSHYGGCLGARILSDEIIRGSWRTLSFPAPKGKRPKLEMLTSRQFAGAERCANGSWDSPAADRGRVQIVALYALRLEGHPNPDNLLGTCRGGYR